MGKRARRYTGFLINVTRARKEQPLFIVVISIEGRQMQTLKLTKIGTSTGVVIPQEMLNRLRVKKGDSLYAIETPEGYLLTPYDPAIEDQLKVGRDLMTAYRETFNALAHPPLLSAATQARRRY
jgi:putative addiction module antidote